MKITALYVGSSLLAPLREAEREIEGRYRLGLRVAAHNLGAPLPDDRWEVIERDLDSSDIAFIFHVTDGENAARLSRLLNPHGAKAGAVIAINCMPELMRLTRMGKLRFGPAGEDAESAADDAGKNRVKNLVRSVGGWMGRQAASLRPAKGSRHTQYTKLIERLPALLKLVPGAGRLGDFKHYLNLFCYFLQPTPANVRSMLLYAVKHYGRVDPALRSRISVPPPESVPAVGVYHPDAPRLFKGFDEYAVWHARRRRDGKRDGLDPARTIGLLLMRTHIVSGARSHYDGLIRAIEAEGMDVLPVISTFMDNREACEKFFIEDRPPSVASGQLQAKGKSRVKEKSVAATMRKATGDGRLTIDDGRLTTDTPRVSQIVSLTGFSFVGGPAMNDSEAAVEFLKGMNRPFRSAVSLDVQTVEDWRESWTGLNPVQAGMQVSIPEIDGATEPFVFGGMPAGGAEPVALEDRCRRIARRLSRWNRLRTEPRENVRLAFVVFSFPPNKGNLGTAAELDVFESLYETLKRLRAEGYAVEPPDSADALREMLLAGDYSGLTCASVAYRMNVDEYLRLCPYAKEIEAEWGRAPGQINAHGGDLLIQGVELGNVFIGVQPTFGYEGDPMRLLMARGGAPHHGFAALYTYVERVFQADAVVHVGTHGALEFMPGKQVGLSGDCWPDRLIGELPHLYLYSVNNPSEGAIARRRSYAELISYLTPPVEDAGLYRELAALKELISAYRSTADEGERERLFSSIEARAAALHFEEEAR